MKFKLWLEFEEWDKTISKWDEEDEYCNIEIVFENGDKYYLNIWTYKYLARASQEYLQNNELYGDDDYIYAPDLFVRKLDRTLIENIVNQMAENGEFINFTKYL